MSAIHVISRSIPGSGAPGGKCRPVSGRALGKSPKGNYTHISNTMYLSLKCPSRYIACNANSSNYKRNPDLSGQRNRRFSRNGSGMPNKERDGNEYLDEPSTFSSRNGRPPFSISPNQKSQETAKPGPREKEIVELFRKVQAMLRERTALKKKEKKVKNPEGEKSKDNEAVDSLLKLLRKHSADPGKQSNVSANYSYFIDRQKQVGAATVEKHTSNLDSTNHAKHEIQESPRRNHSQPKSSFSKQELVSAPTEEKNTTILDSTNYAKHEIQESPRQNLSQPKSSFSKISPAPEIKFQPVYSDTSVGSISHDDSDTSLEPEVVPEVEADSESNLDSVFSEGSELADISEDEISEFYKNGNGAVAQNQNSVEAASDLSEMKVAQLRALAKSRGMTGYSKLKKSELVELLGGSI